MADKIHYEHILYIIFASIIILFMFFDLGIFNRKAHEIKFKEALYQTIFWVVISFAFNYLIYLYIGKKEAIEYLTTYVTEKSLSIDNIFVFIIILNFFDIKKKHYHKILVYGILGAVIFRALFIFIGGMLVEQFSWILYIFGAVLVYTGVKLFFTKEDKKFNPDDNILYKYLTRHFKFSPDKDSGKIIIKENGVRHFTVLFLVIVVIESTDIIFALDSIPAVFSITQDTFVIYTSNIFAIMGLRSMFFLLRNVINRFKFLQQGISIVLVFIGAKMLAEIFGYEFSISLSLLIILIILISSILLSATLRKHIHYLKENDEDKN
ncbi:MAG: TerC/Alx family metal homeostasis membrane protein [Bacteroidota bacterium]|nr:TerC/Alx family metal homeostasis membrane protein [Bacteroidota bacterium]